MKEGTRYASAFKKAYTKLRQSVGSPAIPEPDDPVRRLAIAILGYDVGDAAAGKALDRAFVSVLDWNELRVSNTDEVQRAVGPTIGRERCEQLLLALRAVYVRENVVSLGRLLTLGRREARQYLDSLEGVDEYVAASVVLWSLGGHAIPVSDKVLEALRASELIHPSASRAEVQAFLERHVSAADAKETCLVLQSLGRNSRPAAKPKAKGKATTSSRKRRLFK